MQSIESIACDSCGIRIRKVRPCTSKWIITVDKGLLPLHVAADSQEQIMTADERLSLVRAIWQVYPEAVNTMHKEYQLPPFALPVIPNYSYPSLEDSRLYSGLSTTSLMLRQQPEMLSVAISQCTNAKEEVKRPTKRLRSGSI